MKTIDMTPTWETAANIYIEVIGNPKASAQGVKIAKEELLRLARIVDKMKANAQKELWYN